MATVDCDLLSRIGLSKADFERAILSKCGGAGAELIGLKVADNVEMKGGGYLSAIFPVELTWQGNEVAALPESVVVKAPSGAKLSDEHGEYSVDVENYLPGAHAAECRALATMAGVPGVPTPKVYYARTFSADAGGLIVMENLGGAAHFPVGVGATEAQVKAMLECLASLHAHIYSQEDLSWQTGFVFGKEMFAKTLEALPRDMLPLLARQGGNRMESTLSMIPADSVVKSPEVGAEWIADAARRTGLPPVLVHGDTWSYNIFWRADGNGGATSELAALIDWQLAHRGAPTEDIAYFLSISVSGDYRRQNLDTLLRFYYGRLTEKLSARSKAVPFSYDQLVEGYKKTLPASVLFVSFAAPLFISSGMVSEESEVNFLLDTVRDLIEDTWGSG